MKKCLIKIVFIFVILFSSFIYSIKWLDSINFSIDTQVLDILIKNSSSMNKENLIINSIVRTITDDRYNPVSIILNKYPKKNEELVENMVAVYEKEPVVYIYNTHQGEKYNALNNINLNFSVLDAGFLLQEELLKYDIYSIVEKGSIKDILDTNNWKYASSYKVSRMYLENAKKKNSSLLYFVDLHRDSVSKKISTITINGKSYAKTMFLLGLENANYKENEKIIKKLDNWLDINYPGLSRGIYKKSGKGVNGVYNQDFSKNCILIEVGGSENTTEEVANSIEVIAQMLNYYLGDSL